ADYGLEPAADTITVTEESVPGAPTTTHTLKLGKPAEGGGRYAQMVGNPSVVVLPATTVRDLMRAALDFADKALLTLEPNAIRAIRRQMKDNDLEITRSGGWKIVKPAEQK